MRSEDDGRRSPWLTTVLYLLGTAVLAADVWGAVFWARVGGGLGTAVAAVGTVVAVTLLAVLASDLWRQLRLTRPDTSSEGSVPAVGRPD